MHLRYRFATLLTLCLSCVAVAAFAAKPTPTTESIGTVTNIERIDLSTPNSTAAACKVGENGAPAFLLDYLLPPQDEYFTLLDPASCAACPAPALLLTTAHAFLNFRVDCSMSVTVRIVGATENGGCSTPDPNTVLCPPTNYTLAPGAIGNFDFSMALPAGCCIDRPVPLDHRQLARHLPGHTGRPAAARRHRQLRVVPLVELLSGRPPERAVLGRIRRQPDHERGCRLLSGDAGPARDLGSPQDALPLDSSFFWLEISRARSV